MAMGQADLIKMVRGYQQTALIMALVELDLCSVLSEYREGASPPELATRLGLHLRPLTALMEAAAASELLLTQDGKYFNTELSLEYLVSGSPRYMGASIKGYADQYAGYVKLAEAVRHGTQVMPNLQNQEAVTTADPALRRLLLGLHSSGKQVIPLLLPHLVPMLAKAHRLLDVGCGAGTYALAFAEQYPNLEATLLDQAAVLKITEEIIASSHAQNRLHLRPADYRTAEFGEKNFDIVLFFQVLRTESPATIQSLLEKAARALQPGGSLVIYDTLLEEGRTSPTENVFQNLTLALTYAEGGLFTPGELAGWLKAAGFEQPQVQPINVARPMLLAWAARKER